jgi:predicted flap endonuclease-1-like 5' DNA nuclease
MAAKKSVGLEDLAKFASDFVTAQKGMWDHAAWTDFVSSLKARGFDISGDTQRNLGELLEAMKRIYAAAASTDSAKSSLRKIVNDSVGFIKRQKGVWGNSEWEGFLQTMERNTLTLTEGTTAYLGGVLESIKVFYSILPASAVEKSASLPAPKPSPAAKPASPPAPKASPATKPVPAGPKDAEAKPAGAKVEQKPSAQKSDKKDDLTAITGIGPALAKKLNSAGIVGYAQLAAISDKEVAHLEKNVIKFSGRIKRDDWVGQAKKLSRQ